MLWIWVGLFAVTTLFSFVTLPVEFDASRRALVWMESSGSRRQHRARKSEKRPLLGRHDLRRRRHRLARPAAVFPHDGARPQGLIDFIWRLIVSRRCAGHGLAR